MNAGAAVLRKVDYEQLHKGLTSSYRVPAHSMFYVMSLLCLQSIEFKG